MVFLRKFVSFIYISGKIVEEMFISTHMLFILGELS